MDEFTALVVIPALAVLYGIVMSGPIGAIVGFVFGVPLGALLLFAGNDPDDRIEELKREVEALRRAQEEEDGRGVS
jgi:hypothetical protein